MNIDQRQRYLSLLGIQAWTLRHTDQHQVVTGSAVQTVAQSEPASIDNAFTLREIDAESRVFEDVNWQTLRQRVVNCTACSLHETRTQAVFGVGSESADWLIVGEAPGAEEDRQGEPFVGRAGQLLNNMLFAMGLNRERVYIANILKCRPPNNRDPRPEEVVKCEVYLHRQISLLQPRVILAVGRIAAQNLLKRQDSLSTIRGKVFHYSDTTIPVVVTYHPAYLLRTPRDKSKAWQDLQLAQTLFNTLGARQ